MAADYSHHRARLNHRQQINALLSEIQITSVAFV